MAVFLVNSRLGLLCATPIFLSAGATLLPKLRVHFAEFLNASSLVRLRLLILPTCVGFRYGPHKPDLRQYFPAPWLLPLRFDFLSAPSAAHLSMWIYLHASSARRINRDFRHPAGSHLMRPALETYGGSGF